MNTVILAAAFAATNAVANLPPVIVEASRLDRSKDEIASHVDVITRPDIESSGARNTVELLEKRANLFVRKPNSNPALAQVSLRGYGANSFGRVKILVDGEELNNPDMSAQDLVRVPLRSIRRIEVLRGPQTVLHGGDASAGVINIVSDAESCERKSELEVRGGNLGQVGAHAGTRGGFANENLTYFADLDFDRSDGWRRNSGFEAWSAKGGLRQRFGNGAGWSLKTFYANSQYGLPGGVYTGIFRDIYGLYGGDIDYGGWKNRARTADDTRSNARNDVYGLALSAKGVVDGENSVTANFSFRQRRSTSYGYLAYDVSTVALLLKYTRESGLFGFDNRLDVGTDLKCDLLSAEAWNASHPLNYDNDYSRLGGALFARDEIFLLEELSLFAGVRGEGFVSRDEYGRPGATGSARASKNAVAGEAGANWRPADGLKVFAKGTRFYHAPLADELFSAYGVPNLSLKPEVGNNVECGIDWTFSDGFSFALTGFHSELEDEIMYLNWANGNAPDDTARTGFETSLAWTRDKIGSAGILYSYVSSRFSEGIYEGNAVPMVPRQQVRAFGEYYLVDSIAAHGGYRFVGLQRYGGDLANEGGSLPAYGIFDAGIRVRPSWGGLDGFTFAFTVDNLFDRRYCDYGEYFNPWYVYPAAGRSYLFTVRYEF